LLEPSAFNTTEEVFDGDGDVFQHDLTRLRTLVAQLSQIPCDNEARTVLLDE
jgi:hypothetical protein